MKKGQTNAGSFKLGYRQKTGSGNPAWKGDAVGYAALHAWVEKTLGKPRLCLSCGTHDAKRYEWANVSGEYKRVPLDWVRLCIRCHRRYDRDSYVGINRSNKTSRFKGVSWYKPTKRWKAQIKVDGVVHSLGYFQKEEDAALVYDAVSKWVSKQQKLIGGYFPKAD